MAGILTYNNSIDVNLARTLYEFRPKCNTDHQFLQYFTTLYSILQLISPACPFGEINFSCCYLPLTFDLAPLSFTLEPKANLESNNHAADRKLGLKWTFSIGIRGLWYLCPSAD